MIHYGQSNYEDAVKDFDMVLEKYPDNNKTADALFIKARAWCRCGPQDRRRR